MEDDTNFKKADIEPGFGRFPGMPRTIAMGVALACAVGGLYLFAASYQAGRVALISNSDLPTATARLIEMSPPRRAL